MADGGVTGHKMPSIQFWKKLYFNFEWENSAPTESLFLVWAEGDLGPLQHQNGALYGK